MCTLVSSLGIDAGQGLALHRKWLSEGWGDASVKFLPCKHEGLSLDPEHSCKEPGVVIRSCNPSSGAMVTGGF